jgi:peptidoglycan/LPS O-acetylase OafA/YrhL
LEFSKKGYLYSLDYLRGFAAVAVCLYHFAGRPDYIPDDSIFKAVTDFGHYGVEIFFVISGLVIPYSMEKGKYTIGKFSTFLKKRFIRIEPPYLICVVLVLILNYFTTITPFYVGKKFEIDYLQVFYHLGYLNAFMGMDWLNQVFWTLAVEFQYYLLIALIFPVISSKNTFIWITSLLIFNFLSTSPDRNLVFNFSIFFTAGILIFRFLCAKFTTKEFILAMLCTLAFTFNRYSITEVLVILFTTIVVLSSLKPTFLSTFFGEISYSLYLLHLPVGLRIISLTQRFSESVPLRYTMIFGALLISIGASYLYYRLVEKPFKTMSHKISYSTKPAYQPTETSTIQKETESL